MRDIPVQIVLLVRCSKSKPNFHIHAVTTETCSLGSCMSRVGSPGSQPDCSCFVLAVNDKPPPTCNLDITTSCLNVSALLGPDDRTTSIAAA